MKIIINSDTKNILFKRKEIKFTAEHAGEATPSRKQVLATLSATVGGEKDLLVLVKIKSIFGADKSDGLAHLYETKKDLDKFSPKFLASRGIKKVKAEAAPAPAEAPKPAEVKPEEASK